MLKYVRETKAGKEISAFAVTNKKGKLVAKVQAHHSYARCIVNAWDMTEDPAFKESTGNNLDDALAGLTIAGYTLAGHSDNRYGKSQGFWKRSAKEKKGFYFANYELRDKAGSRIDIHDVCYSESCREKVLGFAYDPHMLAMVANLSDNEKQLKLGRVFISKMIEAGEFTEGFSSYYQEAGLKFLESKGFIVHQAI